MSTWTACPSGFGGYATAAWVVDTGAWLGPGSGTVDAPPYYTLPAGYNEIDYYVGDPSGAPLDGYAPANQWDAYTTLFGGVYDFNPDTTAGSHAGQHLYVALYPDSGSLTGTDPSPLDAMSLVIPAYGGTAAAPTPTWVDSTLWGAKVADCGPYTGDWPPYPPLPATLALEADTSEIDYFIAAPNPSNDPAAVADGSYNTAWVDVARTGSAPADWTASHGRSGTATDDPTVVPAGAHLFAFWFAGGGSVPAHAPLELVPANMAAGGTGPAGGFAGPDWSGWQDEAPFATSAGVDAATTSTRANATATPYPALLPDPQATGRGYYHSAVLGAAYDGTSVYSTSDDPTGVPPGVKAQLHVAASESTVGGAHYSTEVDVFTDVQATTYDYTPFDAAPPGFDALTPGIDYGFTVPQITNSAYWEREAGPIVWGWTTWAPTVTSSASASKVTGVAATGPVDGGDTAYLLALADAADSTLFDTSGGTVLWSEGPLGVTPSVDTPSPIDVSAYPASALVIAGRLASQADPTLLAFMPTDTPPTNTDSSSTAVAQMVTDGTPPQVTVQRPRWRYRLIAGGIKWHTIGGHFATVGLAGLQILTPGVGWVDVVDGPA